MYKFKKGDRIIIVIGIGNRMNVKEGFYGGYYDGEVGLVTWGNDLGEKNLAVTFSPDKSGQNRTHYNVDPNEAMPIEVYESPLMKALKEEL